MWRSILAVVLAPALAAAQAEVPQPTVQAPVAKTAESDRLGMPAFEAYTRDKQIRQGRSEDIAILLFLKGSVTLPASVVPGIAPLNLEMEPAEGFTFKKFRFPAAHKHKISFQPDPIRVGDLGSDPVQFNLQASRNASLGEHILKGKFTFQLVGEKGVSELQQVDVQIPVTVAAHNAQVAKGEYPFIMPSLGMMFVLVPLLIPYFLICVVAANSEFCAM